MTPRRRSNVPPRPRLTLRVGVTGHGMDRLAGLEAPVITNATRVLRAVQSILDELSHSLGEVYHDDGCQLRLISPLADGADSLVAEAALELGYRLHVPMPSVADGVRVTMPDAVSLARFERLLAAAKNDGAVMEFDGSAPPEHDDFGVVGNAMIDQSDLIIAVWNGHHAKGRVGTGAVVASALHRGLPVVWISSHDPSRIELLTMRDGAVAKQRGLDGLRATLVPIITPPPVPKGPHHDARAAYVREKEVRGWRGIGWSLFAWLVTGKTPRWPALPPDYVAATRDDWRKGWKRAGVPESVVRHVEATALPHYAWADNLATYYANRYRSAFVTTFLMAPLAVLFAFLGYVCESSERSCPNLGVAAATAHHVYGALELAALIIICVVILRGWSQHWHGKWIAYRALAERLRQLVFLLPLGRSAPTGPAAPGAGGEGWVEWLYRAVVREAGLASATLEPEYLAHCRALLADCELDGQVGYQESTAHRMHHMHYRLNSLGTSFFGVALLCALVELFHADWWITMIAVALPALGAALHGIEGQGDFHGAEQRSLGMAATLKALLDEVRAMREPTSATIGDIAERAARAIDDERDDWRAAANRKPLIFPA
ncbi:MAG: hypothetical protein ABJD07_02240 [Gemmatimonadaceae bacterium]